MGKHNYTERTETFVNPPKSWCDKFNEALSTAAKASDQLRTIALEAEAHRYVEYVNLKALVNQFPALIKKLKNLGLKIESSYDDDPDFWGIEDREK